MKNINSKDLRKGIIGANQYLEYNKEYVNGLNVFPVPDGDTGLNMSLTFNSVVKKLSEADDNVKSIAKALSTGSLMGARGNSGVILSQLCRGIYNVIKNVEKIEIIDLVEALECAKETAYKAVLKPTEGTILTVSRMIAEFARAKYKNYVEIDSFIKEIIKEGKRALELTPEMLPVLKESGVVDAGGQGLIFLLEGFYKAIKGEKIESEYSDKKVNSLDLEGEISHHSDIKPEDIEFGYCTEFLINHEGSKSLEDFKSVVQKYGNSLVCVGVDNLIKTHIHTERPGEVLSLALTYGALSGIKIDNMRIQNEEVNRKKEKQKLAKKEKNKKYGFVSIVTGIGFEKIFNDLNTDKLIIGGQTMNPSTEDIVKAVNEVNAENVFIFPNNKNIILAAKQAISLVDKNLIVVETKSIPQAFISIINFDESLSPEENFERMNEAISYTTNLQLTYAVRDTKSGNLKIKKNDFIGIREGEIVVTSSNREKSIKELIKLSLTDEHTIVSLYYGQDITEEEAEKLKEDLEKEYPLVDIEMLYGGQPLYYYIASIE